MPKIKILREIPSKIKEIKKEEESTLEKEVEEENYQDSENFSSFNQGGDFGPVLGSGNIQSQSIEDLPEIAELQPSQSQQSQNEEQPRGQAYTAAVGEIEETEAKYRSTSLRSQQAEMEMSPSLRRSLSRSSSVNEMFHSGESQTHEFSDDELSRKYESSEQDRMQQRARRKLPWEI